MFSPKQLIRWATNAQNYIWIEAVLIKETPKAIKILFDNKEIWLPKAWTLRIRRNKNDRNASIAISLYHWAKKFQ